MKRALLVALFTAILATIAAPAQAKTVQSAKLTATSRFQTWESETIPEKPPTHLYVFYRGREIEQRGSGCAGTYVGYGIVVRVTVVHCGPGSGSLRLRYASFGKPKTFMVKLTR
jgi:hypothetical protein